MIAVSGPLWSDPRKRCTCTTILHSDDALSGHMSLIFCEFMAEDQTSGARVVPLPPPQTTDQHQRRIDQSLIGQLISHGLDTDPLIWHQICLTKKIGVYWDLTSVISWSLLPSIGWDAIQTLEVEEEEKKPIFHSRIIDIEKTLQTIFLIQENSMKFVSVVHRKQ